MATVWILLAALSSYLIWRLYWGNASANLSYFFRGFWKTAFMILMITLMLTSIANILMMFAEPYEYQQEVIK
jgi:LPS O-antigen subunit length determinant protein (WzzB/FepE family)